MPFDITTRTLLQYYTDNPPRTQDVWYGPWNTILTTLFPPSQGYVVTPQRRIAERIPDFLFEVAKISTPPLILRTVLIVKFKNSPLWESGKGALMREIELQADMTFEGTAKEKVYRIGIIGPHWIYGEKEDDDGQDLKPLIAWHHVTHDQASYLDLLELAGLMAGL